jgi:hypothetical protein
MKNLQGLMLKHLYFLLILNFPLSMQAAIFRVENHDFTQKNHILK